MVGRVKNGDRSRWCNGSLSILILTPSFPCVSLSLAKLPILHSSSQFLRHSCVQMYSLHCITLSFPKPFLPHLVLPLPSPSFTLSFIPSSYLSFQSHIALPLPSPHPLSFSSPCLALSPIPLFTYPFSPSSPHC